MMCYCFGRRQRTDKGGRAPSAQMPRRLDWRTLEAGRAIDRAGRVWFASDSGFVTVEACRMNCLVGRDVGVAISESRRKSSPRPVGAPKMRVCPR